MSYQDDVALVLEAMPEGGRWEYFPNAAGEVRFRKWENGRDTVICIDANFIVERVIPWADKHGWEWGVRQIASKHWATIAEKDGQRWSWIEGREDVGEAVMAAIAAALRAEQ